MTQKAKKKKNLERGYKRGNYDKQNFWSTVKPFLANNSCISTDFIGTENDDGLTSNEEELVELFNKHNMNKVEKSSGEKLMSLGKSSVYKHPTNRKFINLCVPKNKFDLANASTSDVNKIIKSFIVNKAKGPDGISTKFVKMSTSVIDFHLINIINNDILLNKYSKHAKTATIRPNFKKGGRTKIKNYCPASLLNIFSKIYERFLHRRSHKLRRQISFKISFRLW